MNKENKNDWLIVGIFGLIAQLFIYGAYRYFHKLTIAIVLFTYMVYMLFALLCYIVGSKSKRKRRQHWEVDQHYQ